jgi:DNA-directed RNA polymerase subunit RPC12/RpoP
MKTVYNSILSTGVALALAATAFLTATASGAEQVKGAQKLIELAQVKGKPAAASVKQGDTIAVACPHCKVIWVSTVPEKGAEQLVNFQKDDKVKCPKCGSAEAFCCAGKVEK